MTGTTGLLGRNYLFENLLQHQACLADLQVTVLGADHATKTIKQRVLDLLVDDGAAYLAESAITKSSLQAWARTNLHGYHCQLEQDDLGLSGDALATLRQGQFDVFIHIAASTDFRDTPAVEQQLRSVNLCGTRHLLTLCASLEIRQLAYVGTAYSCGEKAGHVSPDDILFDQSFRNPYEKIKLEAECLVREFSVKHNVRTRIFRPSTISGRLMHPVLGSVSKFDVFYAYGAFLTKLKHKLQAGGAMQDRLRIPLRLEIDPMRGLNVVPADYAAKVLQSVVASDLPGESFHLVNDRETANSLYMGLIEQRVGVEGIEFVGRRPSKMNRVEQLLYKTIYPILAPYCNAAPTVFDTSNLQPLLAERELSCPPVDRNGMGILIDYANERQFGLSH